MRGQAALVERDRAHPILAFFDSHEREKPVQAVLESGQYLESMPLVPFCYIFFLGKGVVPAVALFHPRGEVCVHGSDHFGE
jgi:hypothetical protein